VEKQQKSPENLAMAAEIRAELAAYRPRMTVKELALRSGIAYGTLNRILSGERDINTTQISRIAVVLETTPAKLMDGATERLGGIEGLQALVSEVKSNNVTPLRIVDVPSLEDLDKEQYAANRDKEAETDEQFD
jgi:transcriptional regulator with XRE-family HTH domain